MALSHKSTTREDFGEINKVVLDDIIENMPHWFKMVSIVPEIKQKRQYWNTM